MSTLPADSNYSSSESAPLMSQLEIECFETKLRQEPGSTSECS